MNTPRGRDGPGRSERGRGGFGRRTSTPRPTQRTSELVSSHDTRLAGSGETGSAGISDELGHPTPVLQSGEGPVPAAAEPGRAGPSAGDGSGLGDVPPGTVVYDSGWEDHSNLAVRTVFTAGPANGYMWDWVRDLVLRPSPLSGAGSEDSP